MANENIVGSLFGLTPEATEEALRARQEEKAMAWAAQDTQGKFGLLSGRAAESFRSDIPRLFGYVPPEMKKATDIQGAMLEIRDSGIDMNDPTKLYPAVTQALQKRGLTQEAFLVAQEGAARIAAANKAAAELAETRVKTMKAANEADPIFKLYQDGKLDPATWEQYQSGQLAAKDLILLTKPNHEITEIGEGGNRIKAIVDKTTGQIIRKLGDAYSGITSQTTIPVNLTTFDKLQNVRKDFQVEVKPYDTLLDGVGKLNSLIGLARGGNAKAGAALNQELGALFGDAQKAAAEIDRLSSAGSIPVRIADKVSGWLSGTSTGATYNDIQTVVNAVKKEASTNRARLQKQYEKRTDLSKEDMDFVVTPRPDVDALSNKDVTKMTDEELLKELGR